MAFDETTSESERRTIDLAGDGVLESLGCAPLYRVYSTFTYTPARNSQTLVTYVNDFGTWESEVRLTSRGERLLLNSLGERLVVSNSDFWQYFYPTGRNTAMAFMGWVRAFQNPTGQPVQSVVNGKVITGDAACWFVLPVKGDRFNAVAGDPYFVAEGEFSTTHMPQDEAVRYFSRLATTEERIKRWFRERFRHVQNMAWHPIDKR